MVAEPSVVVYTRLSQCHAMVARPRSRTLLLARKAAITLFGRMALSRLFRHTSGPPQALTRDGSCPAGSHSAAGGQRPEDPQFSRSAARCERPWSEVAAAELDLVSGTRAEAREAETRMENDAIHGAGCVLDRG